ncbi:MAG: cytochrome c [Planctomycetaceae bacterium]|nr:cytochrome c [Planctomycetaceae bacterium]
MSRQLALLCTLLALGSGCERSPEPEWEYSPQVLALSGELQTAVRSEVRDRVGTYSEPILLGHDDVDTAWLKHGQAVYQKRCVQCHGVSGGGDGPSAAAMYPKPRDYRKGIFKFTSTLYGAKPLRDDLIRTVNRGIRGTSMPEFKLLPKKDIEAVVDYVLTLTHRGELENQIAATADLEEEVDPELVEEDLVPLIVEAWKQAGQNEVHPLTPQPEYSAQHVIAGKKAFLTKGCSKCHGEDGRGLTADNLKAGLKDTWQNPTRAADLTSGMLRGGQLPMDVYRRIYAGINGTPMPGFANVLKEEPDTIWDLVAYVLYVSNRRRAGDSPPPGPPAPFVPVEDTPIETGG